VLAYFEASGVSNGGTEAINLIIEKVRRLAHGFKDFDHYRLRIILAADGRRPIELTQPMLKSEDPATFRRLAGLSVPCVGNQRSEHERCTLQHPPGDRESSALRGE
jgi:hypothetical protein